jgi:non-specific serine/threonine protein kinase
MAGAEYITPEALMALWREANESLAAAIAQWRGAVSEWLHAQNAAWSTVGRVCFHLAENKPDPAAPFAFLATYTTRLSAKGAPQHRPLGQALEESRAARDRSRLLALLLPVQRAAEKSPLVRDMVERGDIYHPLAWSAREAHAFLKEVPALEAAGVVVRVPDWWSTRTPARVVASVTVGGKAPSELGADAVLDFEVSLALDGETLSASERDAILSATEGLALIKGRWVEADGARLREVLEQWKRVERAASRDGVSFHEAMRMISGATLDGDAHGDLPDAVRDWSRVEPGPWMKSVLEGLRAPGALSAIDPGGDLRADLRPYQHAGVRWLWWAHQLGLGVCLADDMGLGKTLQVLALLVLRKRSRAQGSALLVVPASLVANWKAEQERFAPSLRLVVAHAASVAADSRAAMAHDSEHADAVLTTYGSLRRMPWLAERKWGPLDS